jgi:hypothetical protein
MNESEFIFWLKGFTDNMGKKPPTREQWDKIRHEIALVFNKVTPYRLGNGETIVRDSKAAEDIFPERDCFRLSGDAIPVLDRASVKYC